MVNFRPLGFSILPPVVKNLLIINGLCYLASFFALYRNNIDLLDTVGLYFPASDSFRPFQIITHFFFHSHQLFHILSNMLALWLFGSSLENYWGSKRFLIYYFVTALGAALILTLVNYFEYRSITEFLSPDQIDLVKHEGRGYLLKGMNYSEPTLAKLNIFLNTPTVGASGAVFGVLLGFGMLFPNSEILLYFAFPIKAKWFVLGYGIMELYRGIANDPTDPVAHFAHLGGMLFGFILIKIWNKSRRDTFY